MSLTPGTVITIPANVKHWHGANKDEWFAHIAVEVPGEETRTEWCEPVTDEECGTCIFLQFYEVATCSNIK